MDTNKHGQLINAVLDNERFTSAEFQCRGNDCTDGHDEKTSDIDCVLTTLDNIRINGYDSVLLILRNQDGLNIGFIYDCENDQLEHVTQY